MQRQLTKYIKHAGTLYYNLLIWSAGTPYIQALAPMPMDRLSKFLIILTLTICSCSENTRLDSDGISTAEERVKILKEVIRSFSDIKDAEFELFNVNGFGTGGWSIPGGSSSDYKFVVKIDTTDISKWREGMTKFDPHITMTLGQRK
jgi:hypothetical protein